MAASERRVSRIPAEQTPSDTDHERPGDDVAAVDAAELRHIARRLGEDTDARREWREAIRRRRLGIAEEVGAGSHRRQTFAYLGSDVHHHLLSAWNPDEKNRQTWLVHGHAFHASASGEIADKIAGPLAVWFLVLREAYLNARRPPWAERHGEWLADFNDALQEIEHPILRSDPRSVAGVDALNAGITALATLTGLRPYPTGGWTSLYSLDACFKMLETKHDAVVTSPPKLRAFLGTIRSDIRKVHTLTSLAREKTAGRPTRGDRGLEIVAWLQVHDAANGLSADMIADGVGGHRETVLRTIKRLASHGQLQILVRGKRKRYRALPDQTVPKGTPLRKG